MDYLAKYKLQIAIRVFFATVSPLVAGVLVFVFGDIVLNLPEDLVYLLIGVICMVAVVLSTILLTAITSKTTLKLQEVISYAAHSDRAGTAVPEIDSLKLGRELVTAQSRQIYDLASSTQSLAVNSQEAGSPQQQVAPLASDTLLNAVGLPLIGIDSEQTITVFNKSAEAYVGVSRDIAVGKPLYDVLSLSFQGEDTLEKWLNTTAQNSVTATETWERVRHTIDADNSKQFDLVASFSSGNSSGTETMLAIFDRSKRYGQDDQEISFVALAVHELRTPLTIMRGYIEVFEDELGPTLNPELTEFMHKMHASAQQLAAFVGNILNVARIEEDQLSLKLRKEDWKNILQTAISDLELRARVHGKHIELQIAEDIPTIGADRISIHEVLNNLVDNAIKYSGNAEKILITSKMNEEGMVETSVQDFGIGIPTAVMPQLFQKFHRSHKSRVQIGGTGLGLYLCKALVNAHGGNIWVRSKEGEGSIFTFTLLPFANISTEQVDGEDGIIRGAHGWIKNHSMYRN